MHPLTALNLAWRNVLARPGRSLAAVAGLALGVAMYVALGTLAQGYAELVRRPLADLGSDATVQRPGPPVREGAAAGVSLPPGNFPLGPGEVERIAGLEAVETASPAMLLWERSPAGFAVVLGFDPHGPRQGAATVQTWLAQGRPLEKAGEALLEKHFAKLHGKKVGERWPLGGALLTIVGTVEIKAGGPLSTINAFVTLDQARSLAGQPPGAANLVFLRLKPGVVAEEATGRLAQALPGLVMTTADGIGKMMQGFGLISERFAFSLGALALAFAGLVYLRLVKGLLCERSEDVGVMKALGWRGRDVAKAFTAEAAILGLAGALAGVALGWLAAWGMGGLGVGENAHWSLAPLPAGAGGRGAAGGGQAASLPASFSWLAAGASLVFAVLLSAVAGWRESGRMFKATVLDALRQN